METQRGSRSVIPRAIRMHSVIMMDFRLEIRLDSPMDFHSDFHLPKVISSDSHSGFLTLMD